MASYPIHEFDPSQEEAEVRRGIYKSLLIHVFFIVVIFFGDAFLRSADKDLKESNLKLVEASVRVDVVAMPKLTVKELKNMELPPPAPKMEEVVTQKEEPKPVPTAPPQVIEDKSKLEVEQKAKPKANVMDMLKQVAKKDTKVDAKAKAPGTPQGLSKAEQKRLQELVMAGNKLREGVALTGNTSDANSGEFELYLARLPELVRPHWVLPSYLSGQELRCRIRIFLGANGSLIRAVVHESSGDKEFDDRAMRAVRQASPFPELAESFKSKGANGEILLGFPL